MQCKVRGRQVSTTFGLARNCLSQIVAIFYKYFNKRLARKTYSQHPEKHVRFYGIVVLMRETKASQVSNIQVN